MKLIFSSKKIPGLEDLPLTKRIEHITLASQRFTVPERMLLNLLKLIVLIPVFMLLLKVGQDKSILLWVILLLLAFPLIIRPLQYGLCARYINVNKKPKGE